MKIMFYDKENYYALFYKNYNYLIFIVEDENNKIISLHGILESPDNVYTPNQISLINQELNKLCNISKSILDYTPLTNWSHGFYMYQYR